MFGFIKPSRGDAERPCLLIKVNKAVFEQSRCETLRVSNPISGVWSFDDLRGLTFYVSSLNAAGVGSFEPGNRSNRGRPPRGPGESPAVKSSTMKGSTEYVRESLPVSELGDGAKL